MDTPVCIYEQNHKRTDTERIGKTYIYNNNVAIITCSHVAIIIVTS